MQKTKKQTGDAKCKQTRITSSSSSSSSSSSILPPKHVLLKSPLYPVRPSCPSATPTLQLLVASCLALRSPRLPEEPDLDLRPLLLPQVPLLAPQRRCFNARQTPRALARPPLPPAFQIPDPPDARPRHPDQQVRLVSRVLRGGVRWRRRQQDRREGETREGETRARVQSSDVRVFGLRIPDTLLRGALSQRQG
ncbi:hypothetical protein BC936DRAFT_147565 [Jimgerdemannia flammicorona]|uniref:Uncharacterized protein n=1 Tax=Jimgerdemannia flammicorona TaxID=994334 RepID=A0A433DNA1_9FUNG|nr:hypothetical protein BC936DRAFT_147565 [Jimgerdemannia flammicorona]